MKRRRWHRRRKLRDSEIKEPPDQATSDRRIRKKSRRDLVPAAELWHRLDYCPLPVSDSDCGLPTLLSNTRYEAFSVPTMLGSKLTVTWHVPPGFSGFEAVLLQGALSL